jgi:hypothetical protein
MLVDFLLWLGFPALVAAGAAGLMWLVMNARIELLRSRYQSALSQIESAAALRTAGLQSAAQEANSKARAAALQEVLAGIRVERRQLVGRDRGLLGAERTQIQLQERLTLNGMPLSGWMDSAKPGLAEVLPVQPEPTSAVVPHQASEVPADSRERFQVVKPRR